MKTLLLLVTHMGQAGWDGRTREEKVASSLLMATQIREDENSPPGSGFPLVQKVMSLIKLTNRGERAN